MWTQIFLEAAVVTLYGLGFILAAAMVLYSCIGGYYVVKQLIIDTESNKDDKNT